MSGIKAFIVLPVAPFHLTVMSGSTGLYEPVADTIAFKLLFKESKRLLILKEALGKFRAIVGLNALYLKGSGLKEHIKETC